MGISFGSTLKLEHGYSTPVESTEIMEINKRHLIACDFFLLYNNIFIYQVLFTLIYHRRSLYSFLWVNNMVITVSIWEKTDCTINCIRGDIYT